MSPSDSALVQPAVRPGCSSFHLLKNPAISERTLPMASLSRETGLPPILTLLNRGTWLSPCSPRTKASTDVDGTERVFAMAHRKREVSLRFNPKTHTQGKEKACLIR